jgi:hypothetical protein
MQQVNPAPTRLRDAPAIAQFSPPNLALFELSANLTRLDNGAPLPGTTIAFSTGATPVCTAVTDNTGQAACSGLPSALSIVLHGGYTAASAATRNYQSSMATASLLR